MRNKPETSTAAAPEPGTARERIRARPSSRRWRVVLAAAAVLALGATAGTGLIVQAAVDDEFRGRTFVVATHDPARVGRRATESLAFA